MSYKTIFIIFNVVIIMSFLMIFLLPFFILGQVYFFRFISNNWMAAIIFIVVIILFNIYFIRNWNMFYWLEKEDWTSLMAYLENKVYNKHIFYRNYIKILINCYIVLSNVNKILDLKNILEEKKKKLALDFALQLGIPYIVHSSPLEAEKYYGKLLTEKRVKDILWIKWNYAFSLLQLRQLESAKKKLIELLDDKVDPLIRLLTLYILTPLSKNDNELIELIDKKKQIFKKQYTYLQWLKQLNKKRQNLQVIILSKVISQASQWMYDLKENAPDKGEIVYN